jgi:hypothetical protein
VTENKDNEGNTVLSSSIKDVTITAIVATQSIKEVIGIPEVAQQVLDKDKKDYNRGLLEGVKFALSLGASVGKKSKAIKQAQGPVSPLDIRAAIFILTYGKSDAYELGLLRGLTLGADLEDKTGVNWLPHKQPRNYNH